eukprot:CAMPEP_0115002180 /NCGR_PEP_ID=MMETSP0216-20121206/17847_1 /TAXON_ID=223996 /ORGANISM="Protocruzia adherens, Strain Boccale" /LENGTH=344 /DNA_ID=CAMNT_0002367715 /DNA_START=1 /DNA_END=1035 /DNA_ORIENTATION=-
MIPKPLTKDRDSLLLLHVLSQRKTQYTTIKAYLTALQDPHYTYCLSQILSNQRSSLHLQLSVTTKTTAWKIQSAPLNLSPLLAQLLQMSNFPSSLTSVTILSLDDCNDDTIASILSSLSLLPALDSLYIKQISPNVGVSVAGGCQVGYECCKARNEPQLGGQGWFTDSHEPTALAAGGANVNLFGPSCGSSRFNLSSTSLPRVTASVSRFGGQNTVKLSGLAKLGHQFWNYDIFDALEVDGEMMPSRGFGGFGSANAGNGSLNLSVISDEMLALMQFEVVLGVYRELIDGQLMSLSHIELEFQRVVPTNSVREGQGAVIEDLRQRLRDSRPNSNVEVITNYCES